MKLETLQPVRCYVRGLFRGVAETPGIAEQREEIETHIIDRIADGVSRGVTEEQAFAEAVESLGNLDELVETIIGTKKSVYVRKANWLLMAAALAYGSAYMAAVGLWFYFTGFGFKAFAIAVPGWLGYAIPAAIAWMDYRKNPGAVGLVAADRTSAVRSSVVGWAAISAACWIVNAFFFNSDNFLDPVWAWMPTFGVLTWPLMNTFESWMVKNLDSIKSPIEFGKD
ncbi:MAG TPA: permease prefix domain 1-containing protein [Treponemataceae bacterium]|nr:permease prefix domain 1-containing protein [Treponemataceae bacterium]HQL32609.1 permease prefix domain 1-containing protein [Treponemataceae bacterium]